MTPSLPCEVELQLDLNEEEQTEHLLRAAARRLSIPVDAIPHLRVLKRSLDARRGRVRWHLLVRLETIEDSTPLAEPPPVEVRLPARVVIVGDGPAGLFCAYELARRGIASVVVDRGKTVQPRRHDLKALHRWGRVDPNSNYCFGEGGAGTYSDGKLYTRSHKRGNVRDVLEILVAHGASEELLVEARPHIGSNRLPRVVTALREHLESVGVEFRFESRVTELLRDQRRVVGVRLASGAEIPAERVVLATGHSARDIFELLHQQGALLTPKAFAMGVRIEHPQSLIDRIQYGRQAGHPKLPPAAYRIAHTVEKRGVFSFCMCPGGFVVPAATEPDELVVNGMSLSKRAFRFANSGLVVGVEPEDLPGAGEGGPLAGIAMQRALERVAFVAGGGAMRAPATRATDFVARRSSSSLGDTSYIPGLTPTNLYDVLGDVSSSLAERMRLALAAFDQKLRGYVSDEAVLIGVETRTSSPVRVERDPESLEAVGLPGLYPCGEGAGYAGGIVSAAVDGMRVAQQLQTVV